MIRNVPDRIAQKGDLFREALLSTQRLPHMQ
jgi:hypothetical protein